MKIFTILYTYTFTNFKHKFLFLNIQQFLLSMKTQCCEKVKVNMYYTQKLLNMAVENRHILLQNQFQKRKKKISIHLLFFFFFQCQHQLVRTCMCQACFHLLGQLFKNNNNNNNNKTKNQHKNKNLGPMDAFKERYLEFGVLRGSDLIPTPCVGCVQLLPVTSSQ